MTESDEPLEDIAASLLNGVMVFLLGAVVPALIVWQVVVRRDWTFDLDASSLAPAGGGLWAAIFSFLFMRWGLRTIRKNVTALRRRRSGSAAG